MDADAYDVLSVPDLRRQHEDQEATVSRLLRSSSARFAAMGEVDYTSLPPLRKYNPTFTTIQLMKSMQLIPFIVFFTLQVNRFRVSQVSYNAGHILSKFFPAQYILAQSSQTRTQMNPLRLKDLNMTRYANVPKVYPSRPEIRHVSKVYVRTPL
jgi:hypothetical protein